MIRYSRRLTVARENAIAREWGVEYATDLNGPQAYIRVMARRGETVSMDAAKSATERLLDREDVREIVERTINRAAKRAELTVESVLSVLRDVLFFDVRTLYDEEGRLKPMTEWPDEAAAAVAGVQETQWGRRVLLNDRMAAVDKAMRYLNLFEADNAASAPKITEVTWNLVAPGQKAEIIEEVR